MNTKFKRMISILTILVTASISLSLPAVSYADESFEETIFSTGFDDYVSDGLPSGWTSAKYIVNNKKEVTFTGSDAFAYSENNNKSVKLTSSESATIKDVIPFNKIVSSGKLHISFDYKMPNNDYSSVMYLTLFNTFNNTAYSDNTPISEYDGKDLTDFRTYAGHQTSQFVAIYYRENSPIRISNYCQYWNQDIVTEKVLTPGEWHHFDMIVDIDSTRYYLWVDGENITATKPGKFVTGSGKNAFKGLGFLHQGGNTKYGYYDNIMITNYNNEDTVKMVAENVGIESEGVKVDVAFSENLTGIPQNGDFVITDSFTGKRINYAVENSNERHAILNVQTSEPSKLNVAFSPSSGLSGTISSQLSNKTTNVYTKHQQDGAVIPVLNEIKVYDYNGNNVNIDGSEVVPIGTTTANISFSEPMSFDNIEDKIYIQNVDTGERIVVDYTPSADAKSVSINFAELMSPNSDYEFVISDTLSLSENGSVSLPREYKWSYKTADDGGFGIFGDAIVVDNEANTAKFKANIIKSDNAEYKGTIIICGYADKEVDGKVYTKLEKVDVKKYDIDIKSITSYETTPIDLSGINRIKCFIRDTDANKNILISEKTL